MQPSIENVTTFQLVDITMHDQLINAGAECASCKTYGSLWFIDYRI